MLWEEDVDEETKNGKIRENMETEIEHADAETGLRFFWRSCLLIDVVWVCCLLASTFLLHNDHL